MREARPMETLRNLAVVAMSVLAAFLSAGAFAQSDAPTQARNVVLVHGAWADGSSWSEVI